MQFFVDGINTRVKEGMPRREATIEGGRIRLRPIMMTTTTTVLGLLPLALGLGEARNPGCHGNYRNRRITLFSTLLTLVLQQFVVYDITEKIKESVWKRENNKD